MLRQELCLRKTSVIYFEHKLLKKRQLQLCHTEGTVHGRLLHTDNGHTFISAGPNFIKLLILFQQWADTFAHTRLSMITKLRWCTKSVAMESDHTIRIFIWIPAGKGSHNSLFYVLRSHITKQTGRTLFIFIAVHFPLSCLDRVRSVTSQCCFESKALWGFL